MLTQVIHYAILINKSSEEIIYILQLWENCGRKGMCAAILQLF